jgi:hypothetical protein
VSPHDLHAFLSGLAQGPLWELLVWASVPFLFAAFLSPSRSRVVVELDREHLE